MGLYGAVRGGSALPLILNNLVDHLTTTEWQSIEPLASLIMFNPTRWMSSGLLSEFQATMATKISATTNSCCSARLHTDHNKVAPRNIFNWLCLTCTEFTEANLYTFHLQLPAYESSGVHGYSRPEWWMVINRHFALVILSMSSRCDDEPAHLTLPRENIVRDMSWDFEANWSKWELLSVLPSHQRATVNGWSMVPSNGTSWCLD